MLLSMLLTFSIFWIGTEIYKRRNLPTFVDSLRDGRFHYFLLGLVLSLPLQGHEQLFRFGEGLRYTVVGMGLVWLGFQAGLEFEIRKLRNYPMGGLLSEIGETVTSLLMVGILVWAAEPLLVSRLGLRGNIEMAALVFGAFATSLRIPELIFYRGRKALASHARFVNPACLILFVFLFPLLGEDDVIQLGPIALVGYTSVFSLLVVSGFLLGILLDFVFHVHKESLKCAYVSLGVMAVIGGPSLQLRIPGLIIGFVAGTWLINTSVQRRDILELSESVGAAVEPIFLGLAGSLISRYVMGTAFPFQEVMIFAVVCFVLRGSIKTVVLLMSRCLSPTHQSWRDLFTMAWRPLGTLSAAILIQGLYVGIDFTNHALIVGALALLFLTQALPISVTREGLRLSR